MKTSSRRLTRILRLKFHPIMPPGIKWKFGRLIFTALFFYLVYRTLKFLAILYRNYSLDSPMDFVELMRERNPEKFFQEFLKFKNEFVPFDFHQIAIENEQIIQTKRKEFIRESVNNYVSMTKMIGK